MKEKEGAKTARTVSADGAPSEKDGRKSKKESAFRPAEIIAMAVTLLLCGLACFLAVRTYRGGEIVFEFDSSTPQSIVETLVVNINTADEYELMKLDGIGEVLALRIVEFAESTAILRIRAISPTSPVFRAGFITRCISI